MRPGPVLALALLAMGLFSAAARADGGGAATPAPGGDAVAPAPGGDTVVIRARPGDDSVVAGRAGSQVSRRDIEERLPRSAPDALRYEPGVFVQQTAHGQASPFLRGRTGQQTVLLFDGIRLNTSTYRQGPNQYFFTVDTYSIQKIEVTRGGASTPFGSDAIGGVINSLPLEPRVDEGATWQVRPRAFARYASADSSFGQRLQVDTQVSERLQVLVGAGYQRVGELRSGGPVFSPKTGEQALVPVFESDNKTQRGTGYRELTADARAVYWLTPTRKLTAATYVFREYDSPRTDQCPAPKAPLGECLVINEQFRTLSYVSFDGHLGAAAERAQVALSFQRQHERRTQSRPAPAYVNNGGRDDVNTYGLTAKLLSRWLDLGGARVRLNYGLDAYADTVDSSSYVEFTNLAVLLHKSRGQYLDGSSYQQGGVFALGEADVGRGVTLRAGGRAGLARAKAPADPESGTLGVDRSWPLMAAVGAVDWRPRPWLTAMINVDRSIRAPNLDDLTSRQQTGPGFQFENPALRPETGTTIDAGLRLGGGGRLTVEGWVYRAYLEHAMTRGIRTAADCPPDTTQCLTSKRRVQLVNVAGVSTIDGAELWAQARWPGVGSVTAAVSYAYSEGPSPATPNDPDAAREPLSRTPPLNGSVDARLGRGTGVFGGFGLRWAREQRRLSTTDFGDARIPRDGTPGFAVVDARLGYRARRELVAALVVENLTDAAYRYHGSSINGPGRGVIFSLESGL